MPSAVPVVACISTALIVFSVGSYIFGARSGHSARLSGEAEPLFARSVEQGALASNRWPQGRLEVPHYGPMIELLSLAASLSPQERNQQVRQPAPELKVKSVREQRRDDAGKRRAKAKRQPGEETATVDPRDAYGRGEPQRRGWRSEADEGDRRRFRGFSHERDERGARRGGRDGFNIFGGFESR